MTFLINSWRVSVRSRVPYPAAMSEPAAPPVPTGLVGEDLETWAALATLLEWLPPALDAQLQQDADLTHFEYGVLFALHAAPDRTLRMSVLAGYANSSLSRLSRAAARLESRGWLRRGVDPTDGRYTLAVLTDAGSQKVDQATPGHAHTVHRLVLDALTGAQKRQLLAISRRILGAVRQEEGWRPPSGPAGPGAG
jgi:DNA-binding MarR family transcriptional regulator